MSLLNPSTQNALTDRDIASGMLDEAKSCAKLLCAATLEAATPSLRSLFEGELGTTLQSQKVIFDYMHKHDWYDPHKAPRQMAEGDLREARTAVQQ